MRTEWGTAEGRALYRRYLTNLLIDMPLPQSMSILVGAAFDIARRKNRVDILESYLTHLIRHGKAN